MACVRGEADRTGPSAAGGGAGVDRASAGGWVALAAGLALLTGLACAGRKPPEVLPPPARPGPGGELRQTCPEALSASIRIRLEPEDGAGVTIDGTLRAILPDTLALSARLGIFRPSFALRADADSAELLLHDERRFWVTARGDEDWEALNPSAWARALTWALCPADLLDRLDGVEPAGGDDRIRRLRGSLRGSPYLAELGLERRTPRLVSLRILSGEIVVLELRQRDFRHIGDAWVPGLVEMRMPRQRLSARVEIIGGSTGRPDHPPPVERLRPFGWAPVGPGEVFFPVPTSAHDPG
jgi:hypothetical protein